ncbi:MAG: hypothetical protein JW797_17730 [Bradymonadales bacterium]|nr:hypothetical protein [Bradymonadales bacterium]
MTVLWFVAAAVGLALVIGFSRLVVRRYVYTCGPDEILVFTGRSHRAPDGTVRGYRVVMTGRAVRVPGQEKAHRVNSRPMSIGIRPDGVVTRDQVKVTVLATAQVAISRREELVHNAVQCFLTIKQEMIKPVARREIELSLRKFIGSRSREQIQKDARTLRREAKAAIAEEISRLGLELELEKLQVL